jgi:hypothetical protein
LKIKLDECISNRVALAIMQVTANREGYEVSFVRHGHGGTDPDWILAFADEGGTAIVSGDHNILQHWPNLIAYTESGLVSFFPPKAYQHLSGFGRAAWWPAIIEKIKISQKGDRWRIPINWVQIDHTKMEPLKDPRIDGNESPAETPRKPYIEPTQDRFPFD